MRAIPGKHVGPDLPTRRFGPFQALVVPSWFRHELAKKRVTYLERGNANLSREERQRDPVYGQVKALNLAQYRSASEALGEPVGEP